MGILSERRRPRSALQLAATTAAVAGTAFAGRSVMQANGRTERWYRRLRKPGFTPPDYVFPAVWTGLYALIALSGWRVARRSKSRIRSRALRLWSTQLALNGAWSPIFFGARRPKLALADIALMMPAITAYMSTARKVDRPAAWMMAPYLAWVGFASVLNAEIVRRNR
jgi:benzodiazapine receptor